jgi:hypothetical protein
LGAIGIGAIAYLIYGVATGVLLPYWRDLRDSQVSLLVGVGTIYAAAFAATIAPLIFRGQATSLQAANDEALGEMRRQFNELLVEYKRSNETILELVEQSKASLSVLQNYALHTMGFVERFSEADLPGAKGIIQQFQDKASILCQKALNDSHRWRTTKAQFDRLWPGRTNYVSKLYEYSMVSEAQRNMLLQIADSYRFTREKNPEAVDLATLNVLNKTIRELEESFRAPDH